jgi:hypothetical protein
MSEGSSFVAEHIHGLLKSFLQTAEKKHKEKEQIERAICAVLDKQASRHISVGRIYKKTVIIYTDSSSWSYQLSLYKNTLLQAVKEIVPDVEHITIKTGTI